MRGSARSSGFTAGDWTAVVNETLAEIYYAVQTTDFFTTLANLNNDIFLAKEAELPAISSSVAALGQAAGNNIIQVSPQDLWSNGLGIASALAGILDPALGAALGIASSIAGIIPSATPDLNQPPFNSTLNGLQNDLANAVTQAAAAVDAQSYEVRQNYGMLRLVGQLTGPSGPWNEINTVGLQGSMNQGFALWAASSCCRQCLSATWSPTALAGTPRTLIAPGLDLPVVSAVNPISLTSTRRTQKT